MIKQLVAVALCTAVLGGCATVYTDSTQPLTLITTCNSSTKVVVAQCTVRNSKGSQFVTTPGVVEVERSDSNLMIECDSPTSGHGSATLSSDGNLNWLGNFFLQGGILGVVVGTAVDMSSGAAYDYPKSLTLTLNCDASPQ